MYSILRYFPSTAVERILSDDFFIDSSEGMRNKHDECPLYVAMKATDADVLRDNRWDEYKTPSSDIVVRFLVRAGYASDEDENMHDLERHASDFISEYSYDIKMGRFKDKVREVIDVSDS